MEFKEIVGKTIESVELFDGRVVFHFKDGRACESVHMPDCCESVVLHHIEGLIDDVLNYPITEAEWTEDSESDNPTDDPWDSFTWTRQRIRTIKGEATFVWLGISNGYYGETPRFGITHGKKV